MPRFLKYATDSFGPLAQNHSHQLAQSHALCIYESDAIYSFIPKNACSTMRLSIARANGCIRKIKDFNWIHKNNSTFSASLSELAKARYSFVFLRDPFSRLVSVYFDKIVSRDPQA